MPGPTQDVLDDAIDALARVVVESFTAAPDSVGPFGDSELRWRVEAPSSVRLRLDGQLVSNTGSRRVRPLQTRIYRLEAVAVGGLRNDMAQLTVRVDLSACTSVTVSEESARPILLETVQELLAADPSLSERQPSHVAITPAGIVLRLRLVADIVKISNPDVDIDARVGLRVEDASVKAYFIELKTSVDFSFWGDLANLGIGALTGPWLALAISSAEDSTEQRARRKILDGIQAAIDSFLATAPDGWEPHQVTLREGEVTVRLCPNPGTARVPSFRHPDFRLLAPKAVSAATTSKGAPGWKAC